jgi:HEAT repeat protein
MKLTLMQLIMIGSTAPLMAAAQVPPTPPTPPAPAEQPRPEAKPAPRAAPAPARAPRETLFDSEFRYDLKHKLDFDVHLDLQHKFELMQPALEDLRFKADEMRWHATDLAMNSEMLRHQALAKVDIESIKAQAMEYAKVDVAPRFETFGPGFGQDNFLNARPRAGWAQEDPADSLYRVAREALNRGEYRRAAQVFNEVTRKFPKSQYAFHSAYWEAFSRYRIGTTDELRLALRILEGKGEGVALQAEQIRYISRGESVDIPGLRARVQGALAARGDRDAAEALQREAAQRGNSCDREEVSVRAEALNALGQMDIAAAMPTVKKVLLRRDECTVELRRRALNIVGRNPSSEATSIILDVAKNDPDSGIRGEAMRWLPRVAGDAAVPQLEELLRTSADEQTQRSVISALGAIDSDLARRAVRTIIERNDAAERVRYDAIISLSRERDGRAMSPDEMNYLRGLYGKMQTPKLKEAVLTSVSRVGNPENEQFLLAIARTVNETPQGRSAALQRLGRMETVKVGDIARLYEVADSRSMREQILSALSQRKENEAVDKMIEIAKKDTDPQIRRYAVNLLSRSNNERAKAFFQSLFDQ